MLALKRSAFAKKIRREQLQVSWRNKRKELMSSYCYTQSEDELLNKIISWNKCYDSNIWDKNDDSKQKQEIEYLKRIIHQQISYRYKPYNKTSLICEIQKMTCYLHFLIRFDNSDSIVVKYLLSAFSLLDIIATDHSDQDILNTFYKELMEVFMCLLLPANLHLLKQEIQKQAVLAMHNLKYAIFFSYELPSKTFIFNKFSYLYFLESLVVLLSDTTYKDRVFLMEQFDYALLTTLFRIYELSVYGVKGRIITINILIQLTFFDSEKQIINSIVSSGLLLKIKLAISFQETYVAEHIDKEKHYLVLKTFLLLENISCDIGSDMLWDLGIIPELLFVVREIPKTRTRKTVIEFILESISLIRLLEIFEYLKDFNVFDWILEIIEEQLELGTDNHFEIVDCALFAISFYFQVFESIKGGDNLNAAKCKFNHSNGRQLLQRFYKGVYFLEYHDLT